MLPLVTVIAGARPNFMKVAPILRVLASRGVRHHLVHTGQHYDKNMSDIFFSELGIPEPDLHLGIGSLNHAKQTAAIMTAFDEYCDEHSPSWIVVVGDVNSTLACSLVAAKRGVKVCHLEAGLRSNDWTMPEEVNRVVTDRLSDLLLTPSPDAEGHLLKEGIEKDRIHFVGNIMIDSLFYALEGADRSKIVKELEVEPGQFIFATLHRPSNVDSKEDLLNMIQILERVSKERPVVFPVHPRTKARLEQHGLTTELMNSTMIRAIEPIGYVDCASLLSQSALVLTDSGGIQEESTVLRVPCLTLRENTERPITVTEGTNQVVGSDFDRVVNAALNVLTEGIPDSSIPRYWDGKTAERCVDALQEVM